MAKRSALTLLLATLAFGGCASTQQQVQKSPPVSIADCIEKIPLGARSCPSSTGGHGPDWTPFSCAVSIFKDSHMLVGDFSGLDINGLLHKQKLEELMFSHRLREMLTHFSGSDERSRSPAAFGEQFGKELAGYGAAGNYISVEVERCNSSPQ